MKKEEDKISLNQNIIIGVNDLATTHSYIIELLANKEDAYKYTHGSNRTILAKCPTCKTIKEIKVATLVSRGLSCEKCSDGFSYPDKFAHEFFNQLSSQYKKYESEYSPDWAGNYRYDNYLVLHNNKEIIVEMDGGFHYRCLSGSYNQVEADKKKNDLASIHNIILIRINCDYGVLTNRFNHIKNNLINALDQYFDLSNIDWDTCNMAGISNKISNVSEYYKTNKYDSLQDIANHFGLHKRTVLRYLHIADELGLCTYIKHDPNRFDKTRNFNPIAVYDLNNNFIDVFRSVKQAYCAFKDKEFKYQTMVEHSRNNKPYKGYILKRISSEEYDKYCAI